MTPWELAPLFRPLIIRNARLRNRFVMPGMQRGFMNDGSPTLKVVDYMRRCAAGGAGLIIGESTSPDHPSAYWQPMMGRLLLPSDLASRLDAQEPSELSLPEAMAAVEPGFVEESRKNAIAE